MAGATVTGLLRLVAVAPRGRTAAPVPTRQAATLDGSFALG